MSTRALVVEHAKKSSDASWAQVHAYIGANDYWYEQARRQPTAMRMARGISAALRTVRTDGIDVGSVIEPFAPTNLRHTIEGRVEASRARRNDLCTRGVRIVKDWKNAAVVSDFHALMTSVRSVDGMSELPKALRTWAEEYPPASTSTGAPKASPKPAAKQPASTASTRPTAARKAPARKTEAAGRTTK